MTTGHPSPRGTEPLPPLPAHVRVSVVIPARDAGDALGWALASALAQTFEYDAELAEVVVAAGDRATAAAARRAASGEPRVVVVDNPSGTTSDALNLGIEASTGEVVARLDAHALLLEGYLARAVATLRRTGAGNVGGRQVPTAEGGFQAAVAAAMRSPAGAGGATYRAGGAEGPTDTVYLGVFRRAALDAVGGFDPRFTRNQDAECNLRLTAAGYAVVFDPQLAVAYEPRSSVTSLARQYAQYGRWRRLTARTHPGSLKARQLAAPALIVGLVGAVVVGAVTGWWVVPALAFGGYLLALVAAGAVAASSAAGALPVALALATMHLAWGLGFLVGPPRAVGDPDPAVDDHA